jgi:hypothetical protein
LRERVASAPAPAGAIAPEQIAGWLKIGMDDSLSLDKSVWQRVLIGLLFTVWGVWVAAPAWQRAGWLLPLGSVAWLVWILKVVTGPESLILTPDGIEHFGRRYGWDEVEGCDQRRAGTFLQLEERAIKLNGPHVERVRHAVEQLLAARAEGALLPRMADVPDHALSRAESIDVAAERGISLSEGDEG